MRRFIVLAAVAIIGGVVLLSGCGVPLEPAPRPVELPGRSSQTQSGATPGPAGVLTETLYMVNDGQLAAVSRTVPQMPTAEEQLGQLLAGPTAQEKQQGLTSALAGTDLGLTVKIQGGQAVVELATNLDGTGRTDDILAFAQIVCTLTSRDDVQTVTFTRAGEQVEVPRADSSLTRNPLTAADYRSLIR